MKKLLLAVAAVAVSAGAFAQTNTYGLPAKVEQEIYDYDSYELIGTGGETTLSIDEEGVFTIEDYCGSGSPISFTVSEPDEDGYSSISFKDLYDVSGAYEYLGTPYGWIVDLNLTPAEGSWLPSEIYTAIVYNEKAYTYAALDYTMEDGNKYNYICFCGWGFDDAGQTLSDFYQVSFSWTSTTTSAELTEADQTPSEYYNLQGVRVAAPEAGQVYIRRQGSEVSKVRL